MHGLKMKFPRKERKRTEEQNKNPSKPIETNRRHHDVATGDVPSYLPSHTQSTLHTTPFLRTTHQKKNLYKNIKKEIKRIISICGWLL
jgi:hypothetical protein